MKQLAATLHLQEDLPEGSIVEAWLDLRELDDGRTIYSVDLIPTSVKTAAAHVGEEDTVEAPGLWLDVAH